VLLKFLLFFLGGIYLLRLLSPFLFKLMFSSLAKKANKAQSSEPQKKPKKKKASDSLGEYIDYEEVE
jgi:hypothetical protein